MRAVWTVLTLLGLYVVIYVLYHLVIGEGLQWPSIT